MAVKIVTDFIKMQLFKKGGAIASDKAVQFAANALEKRLINLGIDPRTLNNQTQLKQLLAYVKQAEDQQFNQLYSNVLSGEDATNFLNKAFKLKNNVVDMTGKKIDTSQGIMGGKSVKEILESGQVQKGTQNLKKSDKVVEREMFEEANEKFNQTDVVADTIAKITSMEPVAALKEANKIISRKGIYKNLNKDQSKTILKDTEDWIFQRDPSDKWDYKKNRPFRDDPDFDPDDPSYDPDDFAKGGRAGYYTGGITDVKPNLSDIGHGSDSLMSRTRLMSPGSQATTSTGLNYLLAEDNDNIRVPFDNGGGTFDFDTEFDALTKRYVKIYQELGFSEAEAWTKVIDMLKKDLGENRAEGGRIGFSGGTDLKRRLFLKLIAALTGGIAAVKSGITGLGKTGTTQATKEVVKKGSSEVPPYFFKLVEKIRANGVDTLPSKDKTIAKKYKDYMMEEDFAGNIEIIKKNTDEMYPEEVYIKYTADDTAVPNKKGFTKVEEYEEFTARPDRDGKMKDIEQGVPDEVVNEGSNLEFKSLDSEVKYRPRVKVDLSKENLKKSVDKFKEIDETIETITKKAQGGRIGFRGGKLAFDNAARFLRKVFGKEMDDMATRDPELYQGLMEVVDMYRARDMDGLKAYMKKFLPHMDDAELEDFIIGSNERIEGMSGELLRLGSGRDYKAKIEMIKEAENASKLKDFDVEKLKPNAEGGRISKWMGGGFSAGKRSLSELLKYMSKGSSHGKTPSDMLKLVNPKQLNELLNKPEGIPAIAKKMVEEYKTKMTTDRAKMLADFIGTGKRFKKVDDDIIKYKMTIIEDMVSKGVDRKTAESAAEVIASMAKQQSPIKNPPKITEKGLLEMENMQKNLLTKDRKLQATGGLTTMLGE